MRSGTLAAVLAALWGLTAAPTPAQELPPPSVEARVWLDRGSEPVLSRGEEVRVFYRTSADAYVAIFHVDTNGTSRLVFPASPDDDAFVRGGRDYRLLFPPMSSWIVEDDPGVGYYFILASPLPLDFSAFPYSWQARTWDLTAVGATVYEDPFLAMDDYIAQLIPDWEYADYTLDWVEYDVDGEHDYPRFLCYDCHGFTPYSVWNPYLSACTSFRVVIFDDPWYYPVNRYRGLNVVYARPVVWSQPRYVFKRLGIGESRAPLIRPRPANGRLPGVVGSVGPRRSGAGIGSGGTLPVTRRGQVVPNRRGGIRRSPAASGGSAARTRAILPRNRPTARRPAGVERTPARGGVSGGRTVTVRPTPRTESSRKPQVERSRPQRGTEVRRPTGRSGNGSVNRTPPARSSGGRVTRPPTRTGSGGGVSRVPPRRSSGAGVSRTPPNRSSGGSISRTPPGRSSGGSVSRAPSRSRSGGSVSRPPAQSRSGGSAARTPPRRSSGGSSVRPPSRSRSGGSAARTPPRRSSGGSVSRPPTRSRSSGGSAARAPSRSSSSGRVSRPPTRSSGGSVSRTPPRSSRGGSRAAPPRRRGGGS